MTQDEFYAILDQINRDLRRGLITMTEHETAVAQLVAAYEQREAA
jgi:hypothetical protein